MMTIVIRTQLSVRLVERETGEAGGSRGYDGGKKSTPMSPDLIETGIRKGILGPHRSCGERLATRSGDVHAETAPETL